MAVSSLYGILSFGIGFALGFYALTELNPGFAAVIFATVPLFTLLLAVAHGQEKITKKALLGAAVAITGIAVMTGFGGVDDIPVLPLLAMLGASLCIAESGVLIKSLHDIHPVAINAVGTTVGAIFLMALTVIMNNDVVLPTQTDTWIAILYMMGGSVVVFIGYLVILEHWSASRASYVVLAMPPVTVLISVWLIGEQIGPGFIAGAALVLAGVYVGAITHHHDRHHLHLHHH